MTANTNSQFKRLTNPIATIERMFNKAMLTGYASDPYQYPPLVKAINNASTMIALSIIKKLIDPRAKSGDTDRIQGGGAYAETLRGLRRDVMRGRDMVQRTATYYSTAYQDIWTDTGRRTECIDPAARDAATALLLDSIGDGYDLVQVAAAALMSELHAAVRRRGDSDVVGALTTPYSKRQPRRRVYAVGDDVTTWTDAETTPVQEVYRAVRRYIQQTRAAAVDPRNGYTYMSELIRDYDSDAETLIYRRLDRYTDAGGATEYAPTTAGADDIDRLHNIVKQMNLTAREMSVLKLRMSGYGYKVIAQKLGVTENSVKGVRNRLRDKAKKIGFTPDI